MTNPNHFNIENIKNWNRTATELQAIMTHKYYLSLERKTEISLEEATLDFLDKYMEDFRQEQVRLHNLAQMKEIEKHRWIESQKQGHDIGAEAAAKDWRQKYAALYRNECESMEKNGFRTLSVTVRNARGIHVRPAGTLASVAAKFDAEVYVSKAEGMDHYNFILNGKRYMNFKSVMMNLLTLCAGPGQTLDFIAYGEQAQAVLDEIRTLVETGFGEFVPLTI